MQKKKIPLGTSDFKTIIEDNRYFVDKSLFIKDVVEGTDVLLFPRPRRFGKTLNLTMLKYFYDIKGNNAELFTQLKISAEKQIMEKQGKHPVIYITFKDAKQDTWVNCLRDIGGLIIELVDSFNYILKSDKITDLNKEYFQRILSNTADKLDYEKALRKLAQALHLHHEVKPVILIDEYDTPIHQGYAHGYYNEIIGFMRNFLSGALKDGDHLEKAVLTGILRVARESIFSGLNNILVCSISEHRAADKFGFTEDEVAELLHYYDDIFSLTDIKYWYDGYNFSETEIYNPWSIISCIERNKLAAHWVNTAANDIIRDLCLKADESARQDLDILTQGGSILKKINDHIVFDDLDKDPNALWSFLLHSGYLRYDNLDPATKIADLSIPNNEVLGVFQDEIVSNWFTPLYKTQVLSKITDKLVSGDLEVFQSEFQQYCLDAISYYDISGNNPEKLYHMFMLGMFSCLKGIYHVKSNREAGLGRNDVMLIPIDLSQVNRGVIFEFKWVNKKKKETIEEKIEEAKEQINEKNYSNELLSPDIKEIVRMVIVFAGKDVRVVRV